MDDINDFVNRAALEFAVEDFEESTEKLQDKLSDVAYKAAEDGKTFWSEEAGRRLNTTRNRYQESLYIYEDFSEGVVIGMQPADKLVLAIEEGAPGFDLKPGFRKGQPGSSRMIPMAQPPSANSAARFYFSDQRPDAWMHPGWKGMNLVDETDKQLDDIIIPKHLNELFDSL